MKMILAVLFLMPAASFAAKIEVPTSALSRSVFCAVEAVPVGNILSSTDQLGLSCVDENGEPVIQRHLVGEKYDRSRLTSERKSLQKLEMMAFMQREGFTVLSVDPLFFGRR